MLFQEQKERWSGWTIDILGTDISQKAIDTARTGLYNQFEVQRGLSVIEMLSHFDETAEGWQLHSDVRRFSRFEQHNLLHPAPGRSKFDLILCRNVLLYFDARNRTQAFGRLASALADEGFLMLGAGENVSPHSDAFTPSGKRASIFEHRATHHQQLRGPVLSSI